jgi:hypothetical protein
LFLGKFCLFFGVVSLLLPPVVFLTLIVGGIVYQLAYKDLRRIQAGEMDPGGDVPVRKAIKATERGMILGAIGIGLWTTGMQLIGLVISLVDTLGKGFSK